MAVSFQPFRLPPESPSRRGPQRAPDWAREAPPVWKFQTIQPQVNGRRGFEPSPLEREESSNSMSKSMDLRASIPIDVTLPMDSQWHTLPDTPSEPQKSHSPAAPQSAQQP